MPERLSEELLAKIVGHFKLPSASTIAELKEHDWNAYDGIKCDIKTLCNISQASRALQRIAEPVLYRVFPGSLDGFVNQRLYIAALLDHPGRSDIVKEFVLDDHEEYPGLPPVWNPWHMTNTWSNTGPYRTESSDWNAVLEHRDSFARVLPQLHQMIRRMTVIESFSKFFIEQLDRGHSDAVLAALILSCSQLESMDITLGKSFARSITARAMYNPVDIASGLAHCNRNNPPEMREVFNMYGNRFPRLQNFSVRGENQNAYWSVGPLLCLIQLRTFRVTRLGAIGCLAHDKRAMTGGRNTSSPSWPGLIAIHLLRGSFNYRELPQIFEFAPSLRKLELTLGDVEPFVRHASYGELLRDSGQKLEHLTLDTRRVGWGLHWPAHKEQPFGYEETLSELVGSLKELTSLKTLAASERLLLGPTRSTCFSQRPQPAAIQYDTSRLIDVLPESLEEFTLLGSLESGYRPILGEHAVGEIQGLLSTKPLNRLRLVKIHGHCERSNSIEHADWTRSVEVDGQEATYQYRLK